MKGDIFLRNTTSGDVGIWVMNGTKIAQSVDFGPASLNWTVAGIGDFDGNGSDRHSLARYQRQCGDVAVERHPIHVRHDDRQRADLLEHCRNRRLQRRRQERHSLG